MSGAISVSWCEKALRQDNYAKEHDEGEYSSRSIDNCEKLPEVMNKIKDLEIHVPSVVLSQKELQTQTHPTIIPVSLSSVPTQSIVPPENFLAVSGTIYRLLFPRPENFFFLKRLKLRSIVVLVPEALPQENALFIQREGIKLFQVALPGNKEPFRSIPPDKITEVLATVLDPENHPLLIHCNRGKHRTGCVVGCIRKLQNWLLSMTFDEYRRFAVPKVRSLDQQFIESYDTTQIKEISNKKGWLPIGW